MSELKIVVTIRGGVAYVYANKGVDPASVRIVDFDIDGVPDNETTIIDPDTDERALVSSDLLYDDKEFVDRIFDLDID